MACVTLQFGMRVSPIGEHIVAPRASKGSVSAYRVTKPSTSILKGGGGREKQGIGVEKTTLRLLKVQRQAQNLAQNYDSALQEYYQC